MFGAWCILVFAGALGVGCWALLVVGYCCCVLFVLCWLLCVGCCLSKLGGGCCFGVVCRVVFVVRCLPLRVWCALFGLCCSSCGVRCLLLFVVGCCALLAVVCCCCLLIVVWLFVVRCVSFVPSCGLFVVR